MAFSFSNVGKRFAKLEKKSRKGNLSTAQSKEIDKISDDLGNQFVTGASSTRPGASSPISGGPNRKGSSSKKSKKTSGTSSASKVDTSGGYSQDGLFDKLGAGIDWGGANITKSLGKGETALGVTANHAVRGAVGGAAIGGTTEAAQGGSFWDGAKSGAFNGAVGWGGYRMGMRATGASSMNPLSGLKNKSSGKQGMFSAAGRMTNTMSKDGNVAKSASALLNHTQRSGLSDAIVSRMK
jgi:hypothetical protein